jgi:hypothetical protein
VTHAIPVREGELVTLSYFSELRTGKHFLWGQRQMIGRYSFTLFGLFFFVPAILIGQSSQNDFDSFFAKFQQAVTRKDTATLTALMTPTFDFIRAQNVSSSDVFKGLDADEGLQWTNLQQAVQGKPSPYHAQNSNTPARVLQCTPTATIYTCLVIFQQDAHHHWRWQGTIMATR